MRKRGLLDGCTLPYLPDDVAREAKLLSSAEAPAPWFPLRQRCSAAARMARWDQCNVVGTIVRTALLTAPQ